MDSSDDDEIEGVEEFSPVKKNKRGKIVGSRERLLIINLYKANIEKNPDISMRKIREIISKSMGIGESTVHRTINEYRVHNTVVSTKRKRVKRKVIEMFDDFERNAVRREVPTLDKIHKAVNDDNDLPNISRTTIFKLLKELQFRYVKRRRNSAVTVKSELRRLGAKTH